MHKRAWQSLTPLTILFVALLLAACSGVGSDSGDAPSGGSVLTVATTSLPDAAVSEAYTATLTASGGTKPYKWQVTSGTLPPGLSLPTDTGEISGTPSSAGTFSFTIQVQDSTSPPQSDTQDLSIGVNEDLMITTTALVDGSENQPYQDIVQAIGGVPPYGWSVSAGSLPAGLNLNSSTGEITGTPTTPSTSNFTARVTDSGSPQQSDTQGLSITIIAGPTIITASLNDGVVGVGYSDNVSAIGGATPYAWSVSVGSLSAGLSLNSTSGDIAGTPTTTGSSNFTVQVVDSGSPSQSDTQELNIRIAEPLTITTTSLPDATQGIAYNSTLGASGGATPYSWSIVAGMLPLGLLLNGTTGTISDTPSEAGTFTFTAAVTDSALPSNTNSKSLDLTVTPSGTPPPGPLTVNVTNLRYLDDGTGKAIYLTGVNTQSNLQDYSNREAFPWNSYIQLLKDKNMNFIRLWTAESAIGGATPANTITPVWYERPGPGTADDGGPKFDLDVFNQTYFDRLRQRVEDANLNGIYVGVMLFQGWSLEAKGGDANSWLGHPYNPSNNINGIDGDTAGDGDGDETHTFNAGQDPRLDAVLARQKAYVEKVIDTLNDLDGYFYEIDNESRAQTGSIAWKEEIATHIRNYEAGKPKRHIIWMSPEHPSGSNPPLLSTSAEVLSLLDGTEDYKADTTGPQANNTADYVIINEGDHLWGFGTGGDANGRLWIWKSFARGLNPSFIDKSLSPFSSTSNSVVRNAAGDTNTYAKKMGLVDMTPQDTLASTSFCLANAGVEYLVFAPSGGTFTLDLSGGVGLTFSVEWFDTVNRVTQGGGTVAGGNNSESFSSPFGSNATILYLKKP